MRGRRGAVAIADLLWSAAFVVHASRGKKLLSTQAAAVRPRAPTFSPVPSLVALVLGSLAGFVVHFSGSELLIAIKGLLEPFGFLWLRALQMVVYPLVVSSLVVALMSSSKFASAGRVGGAAAVLFVVLLSAGALLSYAAGSALVGFLPEGAGSVIASVSESARQLEAQARGGSMTLAEWFNSLIPANPFAALAGGQLLPVLVFTLLFGLALGRVAAPGREVVQQFFSAVFEAMMTLVGWLLRLAPAAIFILCLSFASAMGLELASVLVTYLVMQCGLLLLATLLLYPLACIAGGMALGRFANGLLPAQLVAISTRSSLASLPALLEGARDRMRLTPAVADLVLPLSVAVFKINRPLTSMFGLLVLAHLFAIDLSAAQILAFFFTTLVISFSSAGIPLGGSAMLNLPAYLAAGIPIEGYLLLKTVDSIADILKTLLNVTADMVVAVILNRRF